MSSFDINKVVNSLQSTKTKERNDALNLLESLPLQKLKLTLKQLNLLITAIFKLIEVEAHIYRNNQTNPVELRLSKASNFLMGLIQKYNTGPNERNQAEPSVKLKFKTHLSIINNVVNNFFIGTYSVLLEPCAFDFISLLILSLKESFVREHLHYDHWIRIYKFLIKAIGYFLEVSDNKASTSGQIDNLLGQSFICLEYLIDATSPMSPTQLIANENYFELLPIIKRTCNSYKKRETHLIITILKIINRLLIVLSNQDAKFLNQLITLTIKIFIQFSTSQYESLQLQLLIFLNLDSVANYISLHRLPRLIGDPSIEQDLADFDVDEQDFTDNDVSIRSDPTFNNDQTGTKSGFLHLEDHEAVLYNIGALIQQLISKLAGVEYRLSLDDIGFVLDSTQEETWFHFKSIYLRSHNSKKQPSSPNSWLFHLGVAKLIRYYYNLKLYLLELRDTSRLNTFNILGTGVTNSVTSNSGFQKTKRRKLGSISDSLNDANNPLQFLDMLIMSRGNDSVKDIGLKILVFFLEGVEKGVPADSDDDKKATAGHSSKNDSFVDGENDESFVNMNESSIFNSTFGVQAETIESLASFDKNVIFDHLIKSFDDSELTNWCLVACTSLLNHLRCYQYDIGSPAVSKKMFKLLKLSFPLIKNNVYGPAACNLLYLIVLLHGNGSLHKIMDKSLFTQVDNIVDLSEINGPNQICDESFRFWLAVDKILVDSNSPKRHTLPGKIQNWLAAKWETCFHKTNMTGESHIALPINSNFPAFISWLCGCSPSLDLNITRLDVYTGVFRKIYSFMSSYDQLHSFINLHAERSVEITLLPLKVSAIDSQNENSDVVLTQLLDTGRYLMQNEQSPLLLFQWLLILFAVGSCINDKTQFTHILTAIDYHCSTLLEVIKEGELSADGSFQFIEIFTASKIHSLNKKYISRIVESIPFEKLMNTISPSTGTSSTFASIPTSHMFDDEFSGSSPSPSFVKSQYTTPSYISSICGKHHSQSVVQFIINFHKLKGASAAETLDKLILYLQRINSTELLYALHYLAITVASDTFLQYGAHEAGLRKLLRLFGEGPMSDHQVERNELTIIVLCDLVRSFLPHIMSSDDAGLKKDCYDLCDFAFQCASKDLIISEASVAQFSKFLVDLLIKNDETAINNSEVKVLFLKKFQQSTNTVKINLMLPISSLFKKCDSSEQMQLYNELYTIFETPQKSIECSATFSLFFSFIAHSASHLTIAVIYNLIEHSRHDSFIPYSRSALKHICQYFELSSTKTLFKAFKLEIIKLWLEFGIGIMDFPYSLFGYRDLENFLKNNYKEICAVLISSNKVPVKDKMLQQLSKIKGMEMKDLISDSLALSITLSFTADGIKAEIFQKLKVIFDLKYKSELEKKLPLIILEILRFTDVRNKGISLVDEENLYTNEVKSSDRSNHLFVSISITSSIDLSNSIIRKIFKDPPHFWSVSTVYFIIRRLSLDLKNCITDDQRDVCLKLVKFVLKLGGRNDSHFALLKLLLDTVIPYMGNNHLSVHVFDILAAAKIETLSIFDEKHVLPLIVKLAAELLTIGDSSVDLTVTDAIHKYAESQSKSRVIQTILLKAVSELRGIPDRITNTDIETVLGDSNMIEIFNSKSEKTCLVSFLACMYKTPSTSTKESISQDSKHRTQIVAVLLNVDLKKIGDRFRHFGIWATEFLSNCYLKGEITHNLESIVDLDEYKDHSEASFSSRVKSLNSVLNLILRCLQDGSLEDAACAESILGALIYKYKTSPSDMPVHFEAYYQHYQSYVIPLDLHSCILLNSSDEYTFALGDSLRDLVNDFQSTFDSFSFEVWTSKLLLALIRELAKFTSMSALFSSFVVQVNSFADMALPDFVCYFIGVSGPVGARLISVIIDKFLEMPNKTNQLIDLFTRIVLLIRVGAKSDNAVFKEMYGHIDVKTFYQLATKKKLYKTALLFFEESCEDFSSPSILSEESKTLSVIYESIDDEDLIHGLPKETSLDYALALITRNGDAHERVKYSSAILDAEISLHSTPNGDKGVLQSMLDDGLLGISRLVSSSTNHTKDRKNYEWAWKLNNWELSIPSAPSSEHEFIYKALKQINDYPKSSIDLFRESQLELLTFKNGLINHPTSSKDLKLSILKWFETAAAMSSIGEVIQKDFQIQSASQLESDYLERTSWFDQSELRVSENILLARNATYQVLSHFTKSEGDEALLSELSHALFSGLYRYGWISRKNKESQKTVNATILLNEWVKTFIQRLPSTIAQSLSQLSIYQSACTLWSQGQTATPVAMMKDLLKKDSIMSPIPVLNINKNLIGAQLISWMAESRQASASNIMDTYLIPIADEIAEMKDLSQKVKVYHLLAHFCEEQFKSHSSNQMIVKLQKRVSDKVLEIEEIKSHYRKTTVPHAEKLSIQKYYTKLKSQFTSEQSELESMKRSATSLRDRAIQFYLSSIILNDNAGEDLDKFVSLFLEYSNEDNLQESLVSDIEFIPSYKLIGWCTQLVSRISDESTTFQRSLQHLIMKVCQDHPFHSLYHLISLKKHEAFESENSNTLMKSKTKAAKDILHILQSKSLSRSYYDEVLEPIDRLCDEAIALAEYKASKGKAINLKKLPMAAFWLDSLPQIPPPTMNLPVSHTGYSRVVTLLAIKPILGIATSGISLPKIAEFTLSSGEIHKVLFKSGTDDLRQDSIMEQVFEKVNEIFRTDKETRKRNLNVRTYKAIPLGPRAGMIEFVPNSEALIDVIRPYHFKDALKVDRARALMKNAQASDKADRVKVYQGITNKIKPVLRHFFFDYFLTPDKWLSCRTNYTRGTAATSMVGHVLGLGDRHCNNILIDTNTGEPVHIDLGVAFDQGKLLPIPETVPFRLTRDIVDGFGVTGTEGAFSKSCEHTFRVLSSNKDHILAILDVLRWDPLYAWTITPTRKRRLQEDTTEEKRMAPENDASEAGVAVTTVADKLTGKGLSVEANVRELIQAATDPENLALIYCGWCPFY